jgi:hypothetical protein
MKYSSAVMLVLALAWTAPSVQAANFVGIILSGYEENCEVTHEEKVYDCEDRRELFMGDVVKKKPSVKALKIKWAPYVKGEARGQVFLEVVPITAERFKGDTYAGMAKQYVKDFVKPVDYGTTALVSRAPAASSLFPARISLIKGITVKLPKGDGGTRSVVVTDSAGRVIYQKQSDGSGDLTLNSEEIGARQGESYTVRFTGGTGTRESVISLLDESLAMEVLKGLEYIDREKASKSDRELKKAVYLQLITDAYPEKMDLYWLGDQVLREKDLQLTGEQEETAAALRRRYVDHFRKVD